MSRRKSEKAKAGHRRREATRRKKNYAANTLLVADKKKALTAIGIRSVDIDLHHVEPQPGDKKVSSIMSQSPARVAKELAKTVPLEKRQHSAQHRA